MESQRIIDLQISNPSIYLGRAEHYPNSNVTSAGATRTKPRTLVEHCRVDSVSHPGVTQETCNLGSCYQPSWEHEGSKHGYEANMPRRAGGKKLREMELEP